MKLAIVTLILLTLAIAAPPLYTHWAESRRQQQIQEIKQQARQPIGDSIENVLAVLKSPEPPSVVILYTGGTRSHLEPCGCYQEQSGGLPRRAYLVSEIRKHGIPTLVVDAGDIFDGTEDIDFQRCQINLKAMSMMEYDAVALGQNDRNYGDAYLIEQRAAASFPFLGENAIYAQVAVVKTVGELSIVIASTSTESELPNADVSIALGTHPSEQLSNADILISPERMEHRQQTDGPLWVGSTSEGKTLGFLALWVNADGKLSRHHAAQLALTGDVPEDESVRQLLTDFYQKAAQSSEHKPLFAEQRLEQDPQNGYVSATACQRCHEQEYLQWSATRHAFAFETLLKKERYFDPNCVSCHTTGFGYQTGFQIGDETSTFKGVQCETCHGPGKQHVGNPKKSNIRSGEETSLCLTCHDTKHSPGFTEVVALHTKDVDHSRQPMNLEELLASRVSRMGKPTLELFVMSYCPFGVQAEEKVFPIVKEFGDTIDFKLRFIAQEKATVSLQEVTPFTSLHGYPEVAENIRQLLIAQEYPDKYLDYILCRGKKLDKSWEDCAEKYGIDVERIQALFDAPEAEQLFRENIKRAAELGIRASPTIFVDGHKFRANQLLRASGTPCQ
ncbi:MAG: multiheme c-type cytochrome [Candidatus Poribacteria bacterium]|nr:multiheme c-type cytochrome [Candidatus Poribacteria bacterium]